MIRRTATAALVLAALAACGKKDETLPPPQVATVETRTITVDASATGVVEPINVVEVKSKASGIITRMPVETGTLVKPGDLLVQVDTRDVQNQYDQAMADVRAAEARTQVAAAQKKRSDEMFAAKVITAQEHEASSLDHANAQAQLVRARASLDLAKQRLEDATVTAPVDGTVIEKTVSLGQVITSATGAFGGGTTLLKMADLGRVRVRALFNETDIGQLNPGQGATVIVDAYPERRFQGMVEKIEPQAVVQQGVTLFPVLVTLDNREGMLKPGMNGEVSVLVDERPNVLAIPNDALKNTREAAAAAGMLGLNADSVQAAVRVQMASMRGGGGPSGGPAAPGPRPSAEVAANAPAASAMQSGSTAVAERRGPSVEGGASGADPNCAAITAQLEKAGASAKLAALRDRVQSGELDRSAMREESAKIYQAAGVDPQAAMQCRRGQRSADGPRPSATADGREPRPAPRAAPGAEGRAPLSSGAAPRRVRPQPRLVFVQKIAAADTAWEPRVVMIGSGNFDYTEVLSGLQEGEQVALLASLTLQAQRQAQNERFRQGMGGVPGMSQNQGGTQGGQGARGGAAGGQRGGGGGGAPR